MTTRGIALLTAGVLGALTALGCWVGTARQVAPTAEVLAEFADLLSDGRRSSYTATYDVAGGERVTLVRESSRAALLTGRGRFVSTGAHLLRCAGSTCHRAPSPTPELDPTVSRLATEVTGTGFVTPEEALALVAAAALVPDAKVDASTRSVAGQESLCGEVTGLAAATAPGQPPLHDFSLCVTDRGVLTAFRGTLDDNRRASIELATLDGRADPAAFAPPAGAQVLDVAALPAG